MDMAVEQAAALADAQSELASTLEQIRAVHHEGGYVDPAFDVAHDAWVNYEAAHTALGEIIYAGGSLKNFYVCQAQTTLALERTRLLREWFRLDPPEKPPAK